MRIASILRNLLRPALILTLIVSPLHAGDGVIRKSLNPVAGEYIVVLRQDVPKGEVPGLARALAAEHGAHPEKIWTAAVKGFFVRMPAGRAQALSRHPMVDYVEENGRTFTSGSVMPTNVDPAVCDLPGQQGCATTTDNRLWHLDRVDQDSAVPSNSFAYCPAGTTTPVYIYVVDLGVEADHTEFQVNGSSRVQAGINASNDIFPPSDPCGGSPAPMGTRFTSIEREQYNGELNVSHGTGTASMAAGKKVGIAKDAFIIPVKVARCDKFKSRYRVNGANYNAGARVYDVHTLGSFTRLHKHWIALNTGQASSSDARDWTPDSNGRFQDNGITWQEYTPPADEQTTQMLIDGLNAIITHRDNLPKLQLPNSSTYVAPPAVATVSVWEPINATGVLGTGSTVQTAVGSVIASGVTVIASANNQNGNACQQAPGAFSRNNPDGRANDVITVGGSMLLNDPGRTGYSSAQPTRDGRWVCPGGTGADRCVEPGSNGGPCVTLFAPAHQLTVAASLNSTDYRPRVNSDGWSNSGSSWSAPLVAGVVATYLKADYTLDPEEVYDKLMETASPGVLDSNTLDPAGVTPSSTPNYFLRSGDVRISAHPQDTAASPSAPAHLTVSVQGTGPFSYQWYEVNSDFDMSKRRGAASSTPITQNGNYAYYDASPTSQKRYWVRVTGCGTADSDIAIVNPRPDTPAGLNAYRNPGGGITVAWSAVSGANEYVVERKVTGQDWALLSTASGTSHSDNTVPAGTAALYRVRSRVTGPPAVDSLPSNVDFAHNFALTDLGITRYVTPVRALHITELRSILNQVCDAAGSTTCQRYAPGEIVESGLKTQIIDDSHLTTLMGRINGIRTELSIAPKSFRTNVQQFTPVLKEQIDDLRDALQ